MNTLATILETAGFAVYATPLLLTALHLTRLRRQRKSPVATIRLVRSIGPLLGIALGMCIFGMLLRIWMEHGSFEWPNTQRGTATLITFFVLWVSNVKLEIWTLEPLRKLDSNLPDEPANMEDYLDAAKSYTTHLILHSSAAVGFAILHWT